jgi:hypothetical protein
MEGASSMRNDIPLPAQQVIEAAKKLAAGMEGGSLPYAADIDALNAAIKRYADWSNPTPPPPFKAYFQRVIGSANVEFAMPPHRFIGMGGSRPSFCEEWECEVTPLHRTGRAFDDV